MKSALRSVTVAPVYARNREQAICFKLVDGLADWDLADAQFHCKLIDDQARSWRVISSDDGLAEFLVYDFLFAAELDTHRKNLDDPQ